MSPHSQRVFILAVAKIVARGNECPEALLIDTGVYLVVPSACAEGTPSPFEELA